jgi:hypothetical protein
LTFGEEKKTNSFRDQKTIWEDAKIGISVGDAKLKSFKANYFFRFLNFEVKCMTKNIIFFSFIPRTKKRIFILLNETIKGTYVLLYPLLSSTWQSFAKNTIQVLQRKSLLFLVYVFRWDADPPSPSSGSVCCPVQILPGGNS